MVSMGPNTQHYDFTYKWSDLCSQDICRGTLKKDPPTPRKGSIIDTINKLPTLSKTRAIINVARLEGFFQQPNYHNNHTLFVTEDKNIPDNFLHNLDYSMARQFILSYTTRGSLSTKLLLQNGDTIYDSFISESPILTIVTPSHEIRYNAMASHRITNLSYDYPRSGSVMVNKVGKIVSEIQADNGMVMIMDNIANVL